ncbi:calcium uptake protein, mitochondrial-like [Solanum stenotomum]|uniref:calcium uptake protein, mitochondrial-like n=1 Tax=Solanum stenotomum TaxID=172797 RepID=UPI0020D19A38|nr:calcium uptake protein, mitochondrial-like [Solanum stenotomum]
MHSSAFFRTFKPAIRVLAAPQNPLFLRSICTKSNASNENPSLFGSGLIIAASTIALYYISSSSHHISYADSGQDLGKKSTFLFGDSYRKKVFFKYEKRLRLQSPPEKVFEYFASYRTPGGEVYMTPGDLMRAIVPVFPPSQTTGIRGGNLKGESASSELHCAPSQFFMLFDTDNDGLISFPEYIFFVTLLSIPEPSFSQAFQMFDIDNDGGVDKEEFKRMMELMRTANRQGARHRNGMRFGLKVTGSVDEGGLLEYFFGKDGKGRLEQEKFVQFLRDLHNEISRLEFAHYDYKSQGSISAKDFTLSMVASADISHIDKFLDRVEDLDDEKQLRDVRITFKEFMNLAELRKELPSFSQSILSYAKNGLLSKQELKRAANQVCSISLSDNVVDLIFFMFDLDCDGTLSSDEFLRVLQRREQESSQPRESSFVGFFSGWLDSTNK